MEILPDGTYNFGGNDREYFELKKNQMATVAAGDGFPVAILNRNVPAFYCVPAKAYEAQMYKLEDMELNGIVDARLSDGKNLVRVKLDEL